MALSCFHKAYKNIIILICFALTIICHGLTDDIRNNDGHVEKKNIFKLNKYNEIWSRAITRKLPDDKLQSLKRILNKLDRTELDLKHSSQDVNKRKDAKHQHLLNEVLREYGLFDDDVPILAHEDIYFNDARINQLWQQALEEGHFSKHELNSLHKEMRHMEAKVEEVHALHKETEHFHSKFANEVENDPSNHENLVEPMDAANFDPTKLDDMHAELKDRKAWLSEQVKDLEYKVRNRGNTEKPEFTDDRVMHLWKSVQNASFTPNELADVKEELRHFQKYIDKLEHWERYNKRIDSGENKQHQTHAQEKLEEYKRKVKKFHNTMLTKMKEHRVEL